MSHHETFAKIQQSIQGFKQQTIRVAALAEQLRSEKQLLGELPPAFTQALENVLERLEAGALFTEESCSFSQSDLITALEVWLDKAKQRLIAE